ncbi:MAG TPA: hypothetical protein VHP14_02375 [Anaerolineales bacterium]|nr:hypothetical protein [Anaerolineales bacterium]
MSERLVYQIRINSHLDETWVVWFFPLEVVNEENGEATLTGTVRDQAELHGLLDRVFDLNLLLLSVNRMIEPDK